MYLVHIGRRWWPATWREGSWFVMISREETGFLGVVLGGEAMARRLRNGEARIVGDAA